MSERNEGSSQSEPPQGGPPHSDVSRGGLLGPSIFALIILAIGVVIAFQTVQLGLEEGFGAGGPAFFPLIVAAGQSAD